MFKNDLIIKGFLIGLIINIVMTTIFWLIIGVIGFTPIKDSGKLYLLSVIPAIIFMRICIKNHKCVKMGSGVLLSIILFVALFLVAWRLVWI